MGPLSAFAFCAIPLTSKLGLTSLSYSTNEGLLAYKVSS